MCTSIRTYKRQDAELLAYRVAHAINKLHLGNLCNFMANSLSDLPFI